MTAPQIAHSDDLAYRAEVDGLRAVAVLAVVGFHAFPTWFPGGFVGVDVFFVISGFLISSIILRQLQRGSFTLLDFYSRRVRRIFPALATILAASLLFGWFALLPDEFELLGKHVVAAAAFVSNFVFWREIGYFDSAAALKPLLHLWSLAIEEQFYLVWPLLLMLVWRYQRRVGPIILALTAASFALNIYLVHGRQSADYYFPLSRFWELGLGSALAWFRISRATTLSTLSAQPAVPAIGFALIVAAIALFDSHTPFPGWAALLPTAGALCILGAAGGSWFQQRVLGHPLAVFIGLISYPLYLWHWPLLSFATILATDTPSPLVRTIAVALSIVLSWLTYRLVERPIRRRQRLSTSAALVGGLAALACAGLGIYELAGVGSRFDLDVRAIRQGPRTDPQCRAEFPASSKGAVDYCKTTGAAPPAVIFMGDSRAQAAYDGTVASLGRDLPMMLLGRGGCPPLLNVAVPGFESYDAACNDTWNSLLSYARAVRPRLIVLVGGGSFYFGEAPDAGLKAAAFKQGLHNLVAALQDFTQVVYVREVPGYGSGPSCFLRRVSLPGSGCVPDLPRSVVEHAMEAYNHALTETQQSLPELALIDSIPSLCGPDWCSQRLASGEILYSDALHLSPAGARLFVEKSGLAKIVLAAAPDR